jgi:hypothetical protein
MAKLSQIQPNTEVIGADGGDVQADPLAVGIGVKRRRTGTPYRRRRGTPLARWFAVERRRSA